MIRTNSFQKLLNVPLLFTYSPFKTGQRSFKRGDERKAEPCGLDVNSSSSPKLTGKGK